MIDGAVDLPGARFYRADLHVHTPESKCWEHGSKRNTLENVFDKLEEEGIEVVAITDHNSVRNVKAAKKLGRNREIWVFPGVEISTKEGHVLAIFDPQKSLENLKNWLIRIGFPEDKHGNSEIVATDTNGEQIPITSLFRMIENEGGVAIAPHPNSKTGGFLEVLRAKGIARMDAYHSCHLRGLELGGNKEKVLELAGGKIRGYEKKYACVASSDAHSIEKIGTEYTYIKLGDYGIGALKQALYDPAMRIKYREEWPPATHAYIERVEVSQGFFAGMEFKLHADMNCLVGGKAVGKSLLIELIRFALGIASPIEAINGYSEAMISAETCLGDGGTVTLYVRSASGDLYRIQRMVSDLDRGPEAYYEDTEAKVGYPIREIFDCKIYSQNEVIELGKSLPALLEWLDGFVDLDGERAGIQGCRSKILDAVGKLDDKHRQASKVEPLREKLSELKAKKKLLETRVKDPILQVFPQWETEQRYHRKIEKGVGSFIEEIIVPIEETDMGEYFPAFTEVTPNAKAISKQRESLLGVGEAVQESAGKLRKSIEAKRRQYEAYVKKWRQGYEAAQTKHAELIKSAGVKKASALTSELSKCSEAIEETQAKLKKAKLAKKEKTALEQTLRNNLIPEYVDSFAAIFKKRLDKATSITEALNSFVKIRVLQMSDRGEYSELVGKLAKRSSLRKEQLDQIIEKTTPVEMLKMVIDRKAAKLAGRTGLTEGKASAFIEASWAKATDNDGREKPSKLYKAMLTELKDSVEVELRGIDGSYKHMKELSGGSKCTAILSVALVEGECPLIVDQPEDALDNPFVFKQIVQTVRGTKTKRQYVFATHNPNVAVGSDADLIYCLKATAKEGSVDKRGSIDEISTRDRVVANLEGGESAFRLRSQKYDIVVEDPSAVVLDIAPADK